MKALVTGAGGFCGRHLSPYLETHGVEVHALSSRAGTSIRHHWVPDTTDVAALTEVVGSVRPDFVFHLAGVSHSADPSLFYRINVEYGVAVLFALERAGLPDRPVLLAGSSAEYGMVSERQLPIREDLPPFPYNHYGISKLAQTLEGLSASRKNRPIVIVRPFNIVGAGMPEHLVVQSFSRQITDIMKGQIPPVIEVGNLGSVRDFIDVKDVVRIYWKLIQTPSSYGEVVNVCSGKGISIHDMLRKLIERSGMTIEVRAVPSRFKAIDVPLHYGSREKLERILGNMPVTGLDEMLRSVLEGLTGQ